MRLSTIIASSRLALSALAELKLAKIERTFFGSKIATVVCGRDSVPGAPPQS